VSIRHHIAQVLISLDQLGNALLLGGWADESISARAWRQRNDSVWWSAAQGTIDAMFFWTKDHCRTSYLDEMTRHQLPRAYRNAMDSQEAGQFPS
jgi:hypothetical protein